MNGSKILSEYIMERINPFWINFSLNIVLLHHRFWQLTIKNTRCDTMKKSHTDLLENDVMFLVPLKKVHSAPLYPETDQFPLMVAAPGREGRRKRSWSMVVGDGLIERETYCLSVTAWQIAALVARYLRLSPCCSGNEKRSAIPFRLLRGGWLQEVEATISNLPSFCLQIETKVVLPIFSFLKRQCRRQIIKV